MAHGIRLIAMVALFLIGTSPAARRDDLDKLQGSWQAVKVVNDGQEGDAESTKGVRMIIKGQEYTLKDPSREVKGTLTLDPSAKPAQMAATYDNPQGGIGTADAIYKLEGDRLTICWSEAGGDRPDEFSAESGSGRRLIVLERAEG